MILIIDNSLNALELEWILKINFQWKKAKLNLLRWIIIITILKYIAFIYRMNELDEQQRWIKRVRDVKMMHTMIGDDFQVMKFVVVIILLLFWPFFSLWWWLNCKLFLYEIIETHLKHHFFATQFIHSFVCMVRWTGNRETKCFHLNMFQYRFI